MSPYMLVLVCLSLVQLCMGDQPVQEEMITVKNVPLRGRWVNSSFSAEVLAATDFAVEQFNNQSKSKKLFGLVSITAARAQPSTGGNFKIEAVLVKSQCVKAQNPDVSTCTTGTKRLSCRFEVHFTSSTNSHELLKSICRKTVPTATVSP